MSKFSKSENYYSDTKTDSPVKNEEKIYNQMQVLETNIQSKIEKLNDIYLEKVKYEKTCLSEDSTKEIRDNAKECIFKLENMKNEVQKGLIIDYNTLSSIERIFDDYIVSKVCGEISILCLDFNENMNSSKV